MKTPTLPIFNMRAGTRRLKPMFKIDHDVQDNKKNSETCYYIILLYVRRFRNVASRYRYQAYPKTVVWKRQLKSLKTCKPELWNHFHGAWEWPMFSWLPFPPWFVPDRWFEVNFQQGHLVKIRKLDLRSGVPWIFRERIFFPEKKRINTGEVYWFTDLVFFQNDFPIFISKLGTRSRGDRVPWGDSFFLVSNLYHRKRFILVCFFSPFFHLDLWAKPRIGMASQGIRNAEPHREVQRLCSVPDTLPWEPNLQDEAENFWQGHGRPC